MILVSVSYASTTTMELKIYNDKQAVARQFSKDFSAWAKERKTSHVALSGGSTPKLIFDVLAEGYGDTIDWSSIHFYWGDERCVPPTDEQSNYKMTVDHLLSKINIPSDNIHRILGEGDPYLEAKRYASLLENKLPMVDGVPRFDLVLLGMGDDGHTASIFPHEIDLWNSNDHCVVATHPDTCQQRVSINGRIINHAEHVAFLVTGSNKAEKVMKIHGKKNDQIDYPAALVKPESGNLTWYMDDAAAALLEG